MRMLILCTGNSCRSQMAEGFVRKLHPEWEVYSAGTFPATRVHPLAVMVMAEVGIDISRRQPQPVQMFLERSFDYVITVCDDAREACPVFSGEVAHRMHMGFFDPARAEGTEEERLTVFRKIRDQIGRWFVTFCEEVIPSA
jgi:arsenate reductase